MYHLSDPPSTAASSGLCWATGWLRISWDDLDGCPVSASAQRRSVVTSLSRWLPTASHLGDCRWRLQCHSGSPADSQSLPMILSVTIASVHNWSVSLTRRCSFKALSESASDGDLQTQ